MKRYTRAAVFMTYSLLKFILLKILHFKNFSFSIYNLISPFTTIEIDRKGKLSIGKMVKINSGSKVKVRKHAYIEIGENTFINHNSMLVCHEKIKIGDNVQIGPNVLIYDHDHDFRTAGGIKDLKYKTSPVIIGNNVWIGGNSIILRGAIIKDNCVIGAGTIIKGEFPENSIVVQKRENEITLY